MLNLFFNNLFRAPHPNQLLIISKYKLKSFHSLAVPSNIKVILATHMIIIRL